MKKEFIRVITSFEEVVILPKEKAVPFKKGYDLVDFLADGWIIVSSSYTHNNKKITGLDSGVEYILMQGDE